MSARGLGRLRPTAVLLAGLALGLAVLAAAPPSARAHSELVSSDPEADARALRAPATVVLRFGEDVNPRFATVTLAIGDADPVTLTEQVDGPMVTAAPPKDAPPGRWTVAYRIVSADGHPVTGRLAFVVTPAAAAAPTQTPLSSPPTPATRPSVGPATPSAVRSTPAAAAPVAEAANSVWWKWPVVVLVILTLMGGPAAAAAYGMSARPVDRGVEPPGEAGPPPPDARPIGPGDDDR